MKDKNQNPNLASDSIGKSIHTIRKNLNEHLENNDHDLPLLVTTPANWERTRQGKAPEKT